MSRLKSFGIREVKIILSAILILSLGCQGVNEKKEEGEKPAMTGESASDFGGDVDFLKNFVDVTLLTDASGKSQVAVSAALQGRVMTSTADGAAGRSYGWINRDLFESGDTSEHINVFGGEERLWLGPEGGQYSIYFEKDAPFTLDHWYVPRLLDLEHFAVASRADRKAVFTKSASLENYAGTVFHFTIERGVELLEGDEAYQYLGITAPGEVQQVAYQTTNTLTNTGESPWEKESGLLSVWLLGMFKPSPSTVVVAPFVEGEESELGPVVVDTYFGKVPADRLKIGDGVIFFKGDGTYRSKIGLSPLRAKNVLGSYDHENKILTIIQYNKPQRVTDYVNSLWEIQEHPYKGDVVNAYNDGPPEPGAKPLGPFYELESSSPAAALKPGESITHIQRTYHFEGDEAKLNAIMMEVLGVSAEEVKGSFEERVQ